MYHSGRQVYFAMNLSTSETKRLYVLPRQNDRMCFRDKTTLCTSETKRLYILPRQNDLMYFRGKTTLCISETKRPYVLLKQNDLTCFRDKTTLCTSETKRLDNMRISLASNVHDPMLILETNDKHPFVNGRHLKSRIIICEQQTY